MFARQLACMLRSVLCWSSSSSQFRQALFCICKYNWSGTFLVWSQVWSQANQASFDFGIIVITITVMTRANHGYDKGHFGILNNASVEITILLLDAYCSSITSYCFTKLLPACIALTRVVTLSYQGSTRAVPTFFFFVFFFWVGETFITKMQ